MSWKEPCCRFNEREDVLAFLLGIPDWCAFFEKRPARTPGRVTALEAPRVRWSLLPLPELTIQNTGEELIHGVQVIRHMIHIIAGRIHVLERTFEPLN